MSGRRVIAVIPARGGSKRIPRKNLTPFQGRPLIGWTIEAALAAGVFDRVLVSTDDPEIAAVARSLGAQAPFLRDRLHDDSAPVAHATLRALEQQREASGEEFSVVVQLLPTCPLRDGTTIRDSFDAFERSQPPFQLSCARFGWMNPWWAFSLEPQGRARFLFPHAIDSRSQDLPALYCPSGAIWIARVADLVRGKTFYGTGHVFHPIPWAAAVDIDTADDLTLASSIWAKARGQP